MKSTKAAFLYLKGAYTQEKSQLFERVDNSRTRGNGLKLKEGRFRLDIRRKLFTEWVVWCWNSCPERLWMPHPSLEVFKARLDGPWAAWAGIKRGGLVALHAAGILEPDDP